MGALNRGIQSDSAPRPYGPKGIGEIPGISSSPAPRPFGPRDPIEPGVTPSGGIPSAAGAMGSSPTTDPLTRARFSRAIVSNPFTLEGNATNGQGYVAMDFDRPTIIYCNTFPLTGVFYYCPDRRVFDDLHAFRSFSSGIIYIPNPGRWWIKYSVAGTVALVAHDASDPAVASKYLSEPGTHYVLQTHVTVTSNLSFTILLSRNVARRALTIQNLTVNNPIRLGFNNVVPTGVAGANGPLGIRLDGTVGSTITLTGDMVTKGFVLAVTETGATPPAEVEIAEWV